ncbi:hypothetical protein [Saccharopolyspora phatthalungensis]|uniref:Putative N-acetyltransferase YhbS n=1 Tax=Saccharopolyspora phatthalungensis TaxID=664693 RepID=A0A840QKU3_9PSEU|nr:hypothetical protein [Saccharopolyspora phatthalungensis]MBB5159443.1 putative N-acetyltransferase YhbS [Saccharopolyspora phatthalungensis]
MNEAREKLQAVNAALRGVLAHAEQLHRIYEQARQEVATVMCDEPGANTEPGHSLLTHLDVGSRVGLRLMRHQVKADELVIGVLKGLPTEE